MCLASLAEEVAQASEAHVVEPATELISEPAADVSPAEPTLIEREASEQTVVAVEEDVDDAANAAGAGE